MATTFPRFARLLSSVPALGACALLSACSNESGSGSSAKPAPPKASSVAPGSRSGFSRGLTTAPQIVNVSHYDPKERHREGASFTPSRLAALKRNGARGLIARCGKGHATDTKCAAFLAGAEAQGMLLGSYYFILKGVDPLWQADRFVDRLRQIKASQHLRTPGILMVVDFDSKSTVSEMIRVIDRIEKRTGTVPVIYLENSPGLMNRVRAASAADKRRLARCPYWMALYSHHIEGKATPDQILRHYGVWNRCAMWQYGGVEWDTRRGRSVVKHYNHGRWRSPAYLGNLDRPVERNAFNGSVPQLHSFWNRHAWRW